MTIKELQELSEQRYRYRRLVGANISPNYRTHCLEKLAVIERMIDNFYKEREARQCKK